MNIFILDLHHDRCAEYHCNKHINKMVLESAQILSSALWNTGALNDKNTFSIEGADGRTTYHLHSSGARIYGRAHPHHPCVVWAQSLPNWCWLRGLGRALAMEYSFRYERTHASFEIINNLPIPEMRIKTPKQFALAMPDEYKSNDPVKSYRDYYKSKKGSFEMVWHKRVVPDWFN